ncbi:MAG: type II toxin-antitoxin system HicB family antitoxin [Nitrospira sp. SB0677_bin_15]|nr:type II toxin-antitoxin system HicB family antitoxin [Nitrospira sp. SB0677_bin_15]
MNVMTLGNMKAKIVFDQDAELFRGEILGLTGSADFYGKTVAELKREFKKSLKVYLDECALRTIAPYKSYSGKFVAWVGPDIHEMISIAAADENQTLNAWVKDTLTQAVSSYERT